MMAALLRWIRGLLQIKLLVHLEGECEILPPDLAKPSCVICEILRIMRGMTPVVAMQW